MPANFYVYLLGLAVGSGLLALGGLLGYWFSKKSPTAGTIDHQQFLSFLQDLASWTSEYAGDVSRYQTQLTEIDQKFRVDNAGVPNELSHTLREIMDANRQLQSRLDSAEQKLDIQTQQISNVLVEARTDGLTGLLNRKAFDQTLDGLFGHWTRQGQSFSMGMIDIDHFKRINDTYGHPAGDAVLQQVTRILRSELAQEVCVARYGGEEFAVLSRESGENLATALERVRQHIAQVQIEHESQVICVLLSAGTAEIQSNDNIGGLVRRADEALYASKTGGRNRVHRHNGVKCILVTKPPTSSASVDALPLTSAVEDVEQGSTVNQARSQIATTKVTERLQRIVEEESQRLIHRG